MIFLTIWTFLIFFFFFFSVDKKLNLVPRSSRVLVSRNFFIDERAQASFLSLSQVSSRAGCKDNYRPRTGKSRQEGNCFHAVYALETGRRNWNACTRLFTGVTWSRVEGNDTLKGLKRGSCKFQRCFHAVEGVGLAGARFISRPHRLGPRCYGLCVLEWQDGGRGWSTRAAWKRREKQRRSCEEGRESGKNAGVKKVRRSVEAIKWEGASRRGGF